MKFYSHHTSLIHPLMKILSFLIIGLSYLQVHAQHIDSLQKKLLTPAEMEADLDIYSKLLLETHPGLFRYQTEEDFQQNIQEIKSKIESPLPFYNFYRLLSQMSADIRCAHTQMFPTENIMVSLKESFKVFPFYLYPIEDRLYVLFSGADDDSVQPGYELISINGRSIIEITDKMSDYYPRDGRSHEVLRRALQGGTFSLYYYLFVEQPENFKLILRDSNGSEKKMEVPALPYAQAERNYVSNPVNKQMMSFYNRKSRNWELQILDEVPSTAYIRLESFGSDGVDSEDKAQKEFEKFMDRSIKKISREGVENLIIELRGNRGGWDILGHELFSYISDSKVPYYGQQTVVTTDSEFLRYGDFSAEDLEESKQHLIPMEDGRLKLDASGNATLLPVIPKENRFDGNVYVLMDEGCASTCAEFTAIAKANHSAVLVGNETGGAFEGGNGGSFIHYVLPNSGIYVNTPLVRYEMAVPEQSTPGLGTIPDHIVKMSLEDVLSGRDAQKEFVFELIREGDK